MCFFLEALLIKGESFISNLSSSEALRKFLEHTLNEKKAIDVITIDLKGKSLLADYLIIASGTSSRQIISLGEFLKSELKHHGILVTLEGINQGDWVLVDAGSLIIHLFRPEVRVFYNLEQMWGVDLPAPALVASQ